jgi:hypothetical protein
VETKIFKLTENDYIRTIECILNDKGVIVGISMLSDKNVIVKAGQANGIRKSIVA